MLQQDMHLKKQGVHLKKKVDPAWRITLRGIFASI